MMRRGQSTVEYSLLIITVVFALTLIFSFVRSATAHRFKTGADAFGHGLIYLP